MGRMGTHFLPRGRRSHGRRPLRVVGTVQGAVTALRVPERSYQALYCAFSVAQWTSRM